MWAWDQPELQEQVLLLRRIVSDPAFPAIQPMYRTQVLTNLGNIFSTLGRIVEAVELRDRALQINPKFGMALGNRAKSLAYYGGALYQRKDQRKFIAAAATGFAEATAEDAYYEMDYTPTINQWREQREKWDSWLGQNPLETPRDRSVWPESSHAYRDWCSIERLFLDPLNDLGAITTAAGDHLHLPAIVPRDARSEMLMGYLDTMKQEYASARWTLYEALTSGDEHPSDTGLAPHDTGDEPVYGLRIERMKTTYRTAYSIFDKISLFLDAYFSLNIKRVTFREVWKKARETPFASAQNWPLRGLYWLSRDLFEPEFMAVTDPDSQAVAEIRNHLEHKYLRVVRDGVTDGGASATADPLVYIVKQGAFEKRTLRLLNLARAALIYLVLAIHAEEHRKKKAGISGAKTTLPRL